MENVRFFLILAVSFLGLLIYQKWQEDYTVILPQQAMNEIPQQQDFTPQAADGSVPFIDPTFQAETELPISSFDSQADSEITVETDLLSVVISSKGGTLNSITLKDYPIDPKRPDDAVELLANKRNRTFIHEGGLAGSKGLPTHNDIYSFERATYEFVRNKDELVVPLYWTNNEGITIQKSYIFKRGSYLINIEYKVLNKSPEGIKVHQYAQLKRNKESSRQGMLYLFSGAALSTPEKRYEKYDYGDLEKAPINVSAKESWIAVMEHYFVAALIPEKESENQYYSKTNTAEVFTVGFYSQAKTIGANEQGSLLSRFYAGPKRHDLLEPLATGLELTVDYGMLWFIAKPLFIVLNFINDKLDNWGWAIIILTILLKLLFYPLAAAGYRSMANMRRVQPKLLALKERHSEDKAQLNQDMMKLYKEERINPLGGCLPMLVQIPFFIALYWVLLESVEMRQAPFILWITDLSSMDPFYVLPLLMGVSMWFQQKLNPAPIDPMQAKVMKILPFVFTGFFAFFPSGLVLYWLVNNLLSIAQQWRITRMIENSHGT
ncbi:MAG: membrane protein insertase YidC [Proteobacteria bacterium]|nr:membrane protein insertase YidC [Pseudomonadota bacterium]MBT6193416.1 membrane protein insertase YidC [Pseudomonadota bacterium]MBT6674177.1 membrane protein insertase YidC [Pseudomonadota bacterium]MBT7246622.1 membrane protein insertase YidC [Pseudomonadota bacterium]MBT7560973.1 membrane protein insertase YidC [Pseudomonadota bacterium]